jgi:hypothetical protein
MGFKPRLTTKDHQLIEEMALRGEKLEVIANSLSVPVTRQRIKQITSKLGIDSFGIRRVQKESELHDKMFKKWGANWKDKTTRKNYIYQEMRAKFRAKKANAVRTGIEFSINFGELEFPTHCPVLGIELDYFANGRAENAVSFDRLDSSKGYIPGNVAIISWRANRIKNNGTAEEHQKIADFMRSAV